MTSPAPTRKPLHLRRIDIEGFEREDGLIDIEGTLTDTKPFELQMIERTAPAGGAIHQMTVRIAVDAELTIVEAEARTLAAPYGVCPQIAPQYARLVGLRIEAGFNLAVKRLFRGIHGCSHITELLPPMATTVYQIAWSRPGSFGQPGEARTPLDGCHALRLDGPLVAMHFPDAARAARKGRPS